MQKGHSEATQNLLRDLLEEKAHMDGLMAQINKLPIHSNLQT